MNIKINGILLTGSTHLKYKDRFILSICVIQTALPLCSHGITIATELTSINELVKATEIPSPLPTPKDNRGLWEGLSVGSLQSA